MNTDAFFTTGKQHNVCQDYALATPNMVVLSDGCSSSPHTDFGARLLCRMAVQHHTGEALERAGALLEPLGLPPESLDATLLTARWNQDTASVPVLVHGDGVVVARRRDGSHLVLNTRFPSGAPLYPNYDLNPARKTNYSVKFGSDVVVESMDGPATTSWTNTLFNGDSWASAVTLYEFHASLFDLVLIFSDGILSFRKPTIHGLTEAVPLMDVVAEMLAIKGFAGEFVTRRAKRFLKDTVAKGWHHDDDFAVAGIFLGDHP